MYARGRGAVSGLWEAALDRALADSLFVRQRAVSAREWQAERAKDWARAALAWANVRACCTERSTKADAIVLEDELVALLEAHDLGTRKRPVSARR